MRQTPPGQSPEQQKVLSHIYERYWLTVLLTVRQSIASPEDAEDVLLDAFLAALESDVFFQLVEQQQVAWLRRTAYNKAMDYHRRKSRQPVVSLYEEDAEVLFADDERSPEKSVLRREEQARLQAQIALLPELQQEILRLRFADGLRCTEIAACMQKNEGTVRSLLSRTLNSLRGLYDRSAEGSKHA